MRKCMKKLRAIMMVLVLLSFIFIKPAFIFSQEIQVNGLSSQDAIVTRDGQDVTNDPNLSMWKDYNIEYNWTVDNATPVKAGDTATVTIPDNVRVPARYVIDVYDDNHNVVGSFVIEQGAKTGTLTFNDYFEKHQLQDVHGTLNFGVTGTVDTSSSGSGEGSDNPINKTSWIDETTDLPWWNIAYNTDQKQLSNVVITDTLHGDQEFMKPIYVRYGHYDKNGTFIVEKEDVDPSYVKIEGKKMTVNIGDTDKVIEVRYQTNPTHYIPGQGLYLENVAHGHSTELGDSEDMASQKLWANGNANGTATSSQSTSESSVSTSDTSTESTSESTTSTESTSESSVSTSDTSTESTSESTTSTESTSESSVSTSDTSTESTSESTTSTESTSENSVPSNDTSTESKENSHIIVPTTSEMLENSDNNTSNSPENNQQTTEQVSTISEVAHSVNNKNEQENPLKNILPQTGNNKWQAVLLTVVGLVIVIAVSIYIFKRKHM